MNENTAHNYNMGINYLNGSNDYPIDYQKAKELLFSAANDGLSDAMNAVGVMYNSGKGVPKDIDTAIKWFENAIKTNHENVYALRNLADIYYGNPLNAEQRTKALQLYSVVVEKHRDKLNKETYANICYAIGDILINNFDNLIDSYKYFKEAAQVGNIPEAWHNLGYLLEAEITEPGTYYSSDLSRDQAAMNYYMKGASLGCATSMDSVGRLYIGHNMIEEAIPYLERAAGLGCKESIERLNQLKKMQRMKKIANYIENW